MMSDGNRVPLAHDGMGVFNMSDGKFRLVRNHEDRNAPGAGTDGVDANSYDRKGGGGRRRSSSTRSRASSNATSSA